MSIKTDFLKDCQSGQTITIQEIINLKNTLSNGTSPEDLISLINDKISDLENKVMVDLENTKNDIEEMVKTEIEKLKAEIEHYKKMLLEIYNKVTQFQFMKSIEILRNKNNDIYRIEFENGYYMTIDYINFNYLDEYVNYFPSKINYYYKDNLLAIDEINVKNDSIISFSNSNF